MKIKMNANFNVIMDFLLLNLAKKPNKKGIIVKVVEKDKIVMQLLFIEELINGIKNHLIFFTHLIHFIIIDFMYKNYKDYNF